MSDLNQPRTPRESGTNLRSDKSAVDTVKDESAAVTHAATDAAKDVGHLAKDEATSVMSEAKSELHGLYRQTRSELTDEAAKQQERVATGLHTIGHDFESMASSSDEGGLAQELVRETSQRVSDVATWLSEREPGDVLGEVKSFARRQPGMFIGVAAIAGAVAGRLTRALASTAQDDQEDGQPEPADVGGRTGTPSRSSQRSPAPAPGVAETAGAYVPGAPDIGGAGGPTNDTTADPRTGYSRSVSGEDGSDERPHTL